MHKGKNATSDKISIALLWNIPRKADPVRMDSIPLKTALIDNVNTAHRKNTPNSWADLLIRFFIMILFYLLEDRRGVEPLRSTHLS
jgi:hypothetical protein